MRMRMRKVKPEDPHPHEEKVPAFGLGKHGSKGFFRHVLASRLEPKIAKNVNEYLVTADVNTTKTQFCPRMPSKHLGESPDHIITPLPQSISAIPGHFIAKPRFSIRNRRTFLRGTRNVPNACEEFLMRMRMRNTKT